MAVLRIICLVPVKLPLSHCLSKMILLLKMAYTWRQERKRDISSENKNKPQTWSKFKMFEKQKVYGELASHIGILHYPFKKGHCSEYFFPCLNENFTRQSSEDNKFTLPSAVQPTVGSFTVILVMGLCRVKSDFTSEFLIMSHLREPVLDLLSFCESSLEHLLSYSA